MELNEYTRSRCKWCACCDVYIGRAVECGGFSNDGADVARGVGVGQRSQPTQRCADARRASGRVYLDVNDTPHPAVGFLQLKFTAHSV